MKKESGYLQAPYALSAKVKDVRIAVLAHKILYRWQTGKEKDGFVKIKDAELAGTLFVTTRTIYNFVEKLEEIKFIEIKRGRGEKCYKVNLQVAKKYFYIQ